MAQKRGLSANRTMPGNTADQAESAERWKGEEMVTREEQKRREEKEELEELLRYYGVVWTSSLADAILERYERKEEKE